MKDHIVSTARRAAFALVAILAVAPAARTQSCPGDCNRDRSVTVDELVRGTRITLGQLPISDCPALNRAEDTRITIAELGAAVASSVRGCPQRLAFMTATNFTEGGFATIALATRAVDPVTSQRQLDSDTVPRASGDLLFVVNRFNGDSIQRLDPGDFTTLSDCSTGARTNPQDIAVLNRDKAYVTLLGSKDLLIVDPTPQADCSDFILGSIDLSAYADDDGIPEMDQMAIVDGKLYVSLQRLLNFVPARQGDVVAIDTSTDQVVGEITLSGQNPFSQTKGLIVRDGKLWIGEAGLIGTNDGGVETIDLQSGQAEGFVITESDLEGDLNDFVLISDNLGYAVVAAPDFSTSLVAFDPTTGRVTDTVLSGVSFIADIEVNDRGELYLVDRTFEAPGIRIFNAADGMEITTEKLDIGLPPFQVIFLR